MKTVFVLSVVSLSLSITAGAQRIKESQVPAAVKSALYQKYPDAKGITWEKEKENYEVNWGGKSGEDNSVMYSATGDFIEIVKAIPVSQLPKDIVPYVKAHYKGAKITEAGRVTDAHGTVTYEAEVNKKDLVFDENGNFIKAED